MKSIKYAFLLFLVASNAYATPMIIKWDAVNMQENGVSSGATIYHLYKKSPSGPYLLLASKLLPTYTWANPELGTWTFTVRAVNKNGESRDSQTITVKVDSCWEQIQ